MNKGLRAINFIIDISIISMTAAILAAIIQSPGFQGVVTLIIYVCYYFLFEFFWGRTPGKLITKTIVTDLSEESPGILKILLRTLLRLNPFDILSYLFGCEMGTHDVLSKTTLKKIDELKP